MNHGPLSSVGAESDLAHLDAHGHARMVDVTTKPLTGRIAMARCIVATTTQAAAALRKPRNGIDPLETARIAGLQGAKQTSSLIPLCHPLRVDRVTVELEIHSDLVEIVATCQAVERTGVEMEALTACAVTGLSLVSGLLEFDPAASVEELTLWHKSGGRSGVWQRTSELID